MNFFKPFGLLSWFFPIVFILSAVIVGVIDFFLWGLLEPTTGVQMVVLIVLLILISIILFLFFVCFLIFVFFPYVLKSAVGGFFKNLRVNINSTKKYDTDDFR